MSLDTKYRPIRYSDVVGNSGIVQVLKGIVESGRGRNQSYIFSGLWGGGKTTLSRILARALVCDNPVGGEPCDKCFNCYSALKGESDAIVEFDAASKSTKADMQGLLESLEYSSFSGKRRVYIIDEAHAIGSSASDSLLKSLEENIPGSNEKKMVCIFCTTEVEKIRGAIKSRCAPVFTIKASSVIEISDRLSYVCKSEGIEYEMKALELIVESSESHIRDCLKAVEGVSTMVGGVIVENVRKYLHMDRNDQVCDVLVGLGSRDSGVVLKKLREVLEVTPVSVVYEKLIECSMVVVGVLLGEGKVGVNWNEKKIREIGSKVVVGDLLGLVEKLGSKPNRATSSMLICDVLSVVVGVKEVKREEKVEKVEENEKMNLIKYIAVVNKKILEK